MPTLYVENVPADLYDALKIRAKSGGRSISSEVMNLLAQHVPTRKELARRRKLYEFAKTMREQNPAKAGTFESTEEMLRADRSR